MKVIIPFMLTRCWNCGKIVLASYEKDGSQTSINYYFHRAQIDCKGRRGGKERKKKKFKILWIAHSDQPITGTSVTISTKIVRRLKE